MEVEVVQGRTKYMIALTIHGQYIFRVDAFENFLRCNVHSSKHIAFDPTAIEVRNDKLHKLRLY